MNGVYELTDVPRRDVTVVAAAENYLQPCASSVRLTTDTAMDVHLVRAEALATSGIPRSMPIADSRISGRVVRRTQAGSRPVANFQVSATVLLDGLGDFQTDAASSLTDAAGRYTLCGVRKPMWVAPDYLEGHEFANSLPYQDGVTTYDFELVPY